MALHESLLSFRFSALHRLSPLTQLGPAGPLVIIAVFGPTGAAVCVVMQERRTVLKGGDTISCAERGSGVLPQAPSFVGPHREVGVQ